ncbi:MAG: pyridine nucleotide-disulfide oxidoreductase [Bradyrhizobium sp.]|nr:pyridine nucleotide-disulfide oxidoreductase [Bradyrhizobium sp.]
MLREVATANREKMGGYLQDRRWMARVLDRTYDQSNRHEVQGSGAAGPVRRLVNEELSGVHSRRIQ